MCWEQIVTLSHRSQSHWRIEYLCLHMTDTVPIWQVHGLSKKGLDITLLLRQLSTLDSTLKDLNPAFQTGEMGFYTVFTQCMSGWGLRSQVRVAPVRSRTLPCKVINLNFSHTALSCFSCPASPLYETHIVPSLLFLCPQYGSLTFYGRCIVDSAMNPQLLSNTGSRDWEMGQEVEQDKQNKEPQRHSLLVAFLSTKKQLF